ncbi:3-hydroxyacyl-CoA dehydrogenase family protein [Amycolatopsis sp. CA-230715]|uniref:3-hydroxyacyl-CoA dehydrogenase family protein n=1 Tax=Amycolatopsis sp. CA-230715 TaxID=2745196 RepID=UPI001C00F2E3|nr:3-hydroxyacyl-CoA dehydrogenase family protein [Amycolatopsis sp. CA-230715]QWF84535.1 putative 3-hydroxybutyryl-CoA dehydrogenase [Amycolatopsis sp. CA-230715]
MNEQWHERIAVVGAGVMGSGIATLAIGHGVSVVLVDVDEVALETGRRRIAQQSRHAQLMGALPEGTTPGSLVTTTDLSGVDGASAVIEAVTESPEVKAAVLGEVSGVVGPGVPLVSNTSGIPIGELAGSVPVPRDLVGTHFMNPSYLITMVEVSRGPKTSDVTVDALLDLLATLRRRAVIVRDAPGFVTSRLLHPMINKAANLVGEGIAAAEEVDQLMQGCLGHRTGPLRTGDLIGLDNLVDSLLALHERTGDEACRPCDLLLAKVRDGELGRKTGRGFYRYEEAMF